MFKSSDDSTLLLLFLEKIKSIPVESLDSLLKMIDMYPDVGFVTMNRPHMDLLNDYQPYSYS